MFCEIKKYISVNLIQRIELKKDDVTMTIFYESGLAHIGIVDMYNDIIYYYKNGEDQTLVPVAGQVFENRTVCKDNNMLWVILEYFAKHGEKYPEIDWIEE